jgi:hypothetical protein
VPVFADPDTIEDPSLPNQCGDLEFNDRTRVATTIYATRPKEPQENPWKYWWRRARWANDGSGILTEVRKVSVGPDTLDTAVVELPLSDQYDAIGVVLIIDSSGSRQISDLPFTNTTPGPWGDVQFKFQHWAEITPPTLISVTHAEGNVTIAWSNARPTVRLIDSTIIYRNAVQFKVVGPADTTYTHPSPGPGYYYYNLKHVSWPAALAPQRDLAFPNSDLSDSVGITLGTACARLAEPTGDRDTWLHADQYISAGCSQLGSNKRFRWYDSADVELTDWTTDTLFDFKGHFHTGAQLVILQDSNTTTHATSRDTVHFTVYNHQLGFEGESYVTRKGNYLYVAWTDDTTHHGYWFERYDDGPQWYPATATEQDSLYRTWPAGDYTVDLRQHLNTGVLHRRRLVVDVCTVPGCSAPPAPPVTPSPGPAAAADWGLFGAGPWLGWGAADLRRTLRWYDLWGMPDRTSPFADVAWVTNDGGQVRDSETGWQLDWILHDLGLPDVRAFDLVVSGRRDRSYVFSMAVDPDLGPEPADDVARYDAGLGLVLVADGEAAVGLLLLNPDGADNAVASVQEYGVGRWAPAVGAAAWAAQREPGIHLRGIPGDVQLLLSAAPADGGGRWTFVVLRGATPAAVQARAEQVYRALR